MGPVISSVPAVIKVGDSFTIGGTGFTKGSVVNFFVATATGPVNFGPLAPSSRTATLLTVPVAASKVTTLGQGVASVQVINTDQKFAASNPATAQLFGDTRDGFPNLMGINGKGLAATSTDPSFATDNVETVVVQNHPVTLSGNGFDTVHGVAIDLFCDCAGGKMPTVFLNPGAPGLSATALAFTLPSSVGTGPGSFVISNKGAKGDYAIKSNAVSVPIGAAVTVKSMSQDGCDVTVTGTGFAVNGPGLPNLTVINLFNKQGTGVINLGGLNPSGSPRIPLDVSSSTKFSFTVPRGAVTGPAYVQALNPPFVPFTSSGNSPAGAFTLGFCGSTLSGIAIQGVMAGAQVKAFVVNSNGSNGGVFGTVTADSAGRFAIKIAPPYPGPVRLTASGGVLFSEMWTGRRSPNRARSPLWSPARQKTLRESQLTRYRISSIH